MCTFWELDIKEQLTPISDHGELEDVKILTRLTGGKTTSTEAYRRNIYMGAESRHSRGGKDEKRPDI